MSSLTETWLMPELHDKAHKHSPISQDVGGPVLAFGFLTVP